MSRLPAGLAPSALVFNTPAGNPGNAAGNLVMPPPGVGAMAGTGGVALGMEGAWARDAWLDPVGSRE